MQWKVGALPLGGYVKFADDADPMRLETQLDQSGLQRCQNGEIAAAWTPIGVNAALECVFGPRREGGGGGFRCGGDGAHR